MGRRRPRISRRASAPHVPPDLAYSAAAGVGLPSRDLCSRSSCSPSNERPARLTGDPAAARQLSHCRAVVPTAPLARRTRDARRAAVGDRLQLCGCLASVQPSGRRAPCRRRTLPAQSAKLDSCASRTRAPAIARSPGGDLLQLRRTSSRRALSVRPCTPSSRPPGRSPENGSSTRDRGRAGLLAEVLAGAPLSASAGGAGVKARSKRAREKERRVAPSSLHRTPSRTGCARNCCGLSLENSFARDRRSRGPGGATCRAWS